MKKEIFTKVTRILTIVSVIIALIGIVTGIALPALYPNALSSSVDKMYNSNSENLVLPLSIMSLPVSRTYFGVVIMSHAVLAILAIWIIYGFYSLVHVLIKEKIPTEYCVLAIILCVLIIISSYLVNTIDLKTYTSENVQSNIVTTIEEE